MRKPIDYTDQAGSSIRFGERVISSCYTPEGIKSIDYEFSERIKNINNPVKTVYVILRVPTYINGKYESDYKTNYSKATIDSLNGAFGRKIEYYNGLSVEFRFTNPRFLKSTGLENPKTLRKDILKNPHLHKDIKNNLISNLNRYISTNR